MGFVRLFCGSRSLIPHTGAQDYVLGTLKHNYPDTTLSVSGGAKGPDKWVAEGFQQKGVRTIEFLGDGRIIRSWNPEVLLWCDSPTQGLSSYEWRQRLLARNLVMLDFLSKCPVHLDKGVVGYVDSASKTQGSVHTLSHAPGYGIDNIDCHLYKDGSWNFLDTPNF